MIIPSNVKCSFCPKHFCCSICRLKHESHQHSLHVLEMKVLKEKEDKIRSLCSICQGKNFPLGVGQSLTDDVFQHVIQQHLPLSCNSCGKIFKTETDFLEFGKCSSMECEPVNFIERIEDKNISIVPLKLPNSVPILIDAKSNKLEKSNVIVNKATEIEEDINEDALTPLTKINLRWRRKSKGFENSNDNTATNAVETTTIQLPSQSPQKIVRQTSTPMQTDLPNRNLNNFTDSTYNFIQMSSINTDSTSSESDGGFSPPVVVKGSQVTPELIVKQPISLKTKPRSKISSQATPLRQLMLSKSIQRAIAQHAAYPGLQQRKMCFDSTGSGTDTSSTSNTSRIAPSSPLDLRTSPVIRRTKHSPSRSYRQKILESSSRDSILEILKSPNIFKQKVNIKQIEISQIIIQQHSESPCSEVNMTTSNSMQGFYSCCSSDITEHIDEEIDPKVQVKQIDTNNNSSPLPATPKILGSGLLKKTISFESPFTSIQESSCHREDRDDVFFSPHIIPVKSFSCSSDTFLHSEVCHGRTISEESVEHHMVQTQKTHQSNASNLWSLVTSMVQMASGRSEEDDENNPTCASENRFDFCKSAFIQKAVSFADFLKKQYAGEKPEPEPSIKRKRSYDKCAFVISPTSPIRKVRKIQGRKPIERMRNSK